ncbi:hypothetical protein Tco_0194826 [Tanacetum coccineum]
MKNPSNRCECAVTELVEFIRAHQPVSFELVLIYDSLWIVVYSVWGHVGNVRPESLRLGDIKLLLVAFDSHLKVFHPLKNDNTSGKHPQCHIQVVNDISFQIRELLLNQEKQRGCYVVNRNYLMTLTTSFIGKGLLWSNGYSWSFRLFITYAEKSIGVLISSSKLRGDLEPLEELDFDSLDLDPFDGLASLLIFYFFNPWSDPAEGSSSLSFYADLKRKPIDIQVGDRVMLKVSPWKGVVRFGKRGKLNTRYVGPFKVIERGETIAYKLKLPQQLSRVHNTFHVSNLKKCLSDESLVIPLEELHVDDKLHFMEEPVEVVDREIKQLKRSRIPIIKVRWNSKRGPEFT